MVGDGVEGFTDVEADGNEGRTGLEGGVDALGDKEEGLISSALGGS